MADKLSIEVSMTGKQFEELGKVSEFKGFGNQREFIADFVRTQIKDYRERVLKRDIDLSQIQ